MYVWGLLVPECQNPQLQNLITLNHNAIKYKASDYPVEMQYCEATRVKQLQ